MARRKNRREEQRRWSVRLANLSEVLRFRLSSLFRTTSTLRMSRFTSEHSQNPHRPYPLGLELRRSELSRGRQSTLLKCRNRFHSARTPAGGCIREVSRAPGSNPICPKLPGAPEPNHRKLAGTIHLPPPREPPQRSTPRGTPRSSPDKEPIP